MDWVVNDYTYGQDGNLPNASQVALPLTIPQFMETTTNIAQTTLIPRYALPEQSGGQVAYAVRGHYEISPTTWAVGSAYRLMMRLVVKQTEYNAVVNAIEDPNYSLFAAAYANERLLWQRLHFEQFGGGDYGEVFQLDWKGLARIKEDEALFLYIENQSGITQTVRFRPYLRTLMRAN